VAGAPGCRGLLSPDATGTPISDGDGSVGEPAGALSPERAVALCPATGCCDGRSSRAEGFDASCPVVAECAGAVIGLEPVADAVIRFDMGDGWGCPALEPGTEATWVVLPGSPILAVVSAGCNPGSAEPATVEDGG